VATVGDIVRAGKRVRFPGSMPGGRSHILLAIIAWWISLWDLRTEKSWPMPTVLIFFAVTCQLYLLARLVSAPLPQEGLVDLQTYHRKEGWKYAGLFTVEVALTMLTIYVYGAGIKNWVAENAADWPTIAACVAATVARNRWVQSAALIVILALGVVFRDPSGRVDLVAP
jgi:hypothetical protein